MGPGHQIPAPAHGNEVRPIRQTDFSGMRAFSFEDAHTARNAVRALRHSGETDAFRLNDAVKHGVFQKQ